MGTAGNRESAFPAFPDGIRQQYPMLLTGLRLEEIETGLTCSGPRRRMGMGTVADRSRDQHLVPGDAPAGGPVRATVPSDKDPAEAAYLEETCDVRIH